MVYDPEKHHRRSIRLRGYDYRSDGAYFLTVCTRDRACVFGSVTGPAVNLSRRGMIASNCWHDVPNHRPYVVLDQFIVMPNHVHGIFWIEDGLADDCRADTCVALHHHGNQHPRPPAGSVGAIVGSYKAAVSREINRLRPGAARDLWQPNYFEHVIRTDRGLEAAREYVRANPERWAADRQNPEGDGTDDVEQFIQTLASLDRQALSRGRGAEGDTSVAPTADGR
jgi:REP element-mobilizing transposase RayT